MRADNDGEGGIMALIALLLRCTRAVRRAWSCSSPRWGSSAPRCSSATASSRPRSRCCPRSRASRSSSRRSSIWSFRSPRSSSSGCSPSSATGLAWSAALFGPVMVVWFTVLAAPGCTGSPTTRACCRRCRRRYAVQFFADRGLTAFLALGGVVLTVTGAEALYADMGHFGRSPIRRAWLFAVVPGAGPQLHGPGRAADRAPGAVANPFYLLIPHWARLPVVLPGHGGDRHRLAGRHLGRVLGHPPGGDARLPPAPADRPHVASGGPDLRPVVNWTLMVLCSCSCSRSSAPPSWPPPTGSR